MVRLPRDANGIDIRRLRRQIYCVRADGSIRFVLTEDIFRPLANMLGEKSERPLVALATSKEKIGKVIYLAE